MSLRKCLSFLGICIIWTGSVVVAGSSGDDFSNNLFTDLGPILSLLGEKFTIQFLAGAYTWFDYILFAMAPLGIITGIVSALRVHGPRLLRTLIGRARENIADVEFELMSSVSKEVCELWNGRNIVRARGDPQIGQIIYIPRTEGDISPDAFVNMNPNFWKNGYGLELVEGILPDGYSSPPIVDDVEKNEKNDKQTPTKKIHMNTKPWDLPPNVSLNTHKESGIIELAILAALATCIQVAVFVFAGYATLRLLQGQSVKKAGFAMFVGGEIILTVCLATCAWVVDDSTMETSWRRASTNLSRGEESKGDLDSVRKNPSITAAQAKVIVKSNDTVGKATKLAASPHCAEIYPFWIQRKHSTGDQLFTSSLITSKPKRHHRQSRWARFLYDDQKYTRQRLLRTSHRSRTIDRQDFVNEHKLRTIFASAAAIIGILSWAVQFEGLRLSHWSITIAQLAATGLNTLIRAFARRGMLQQPRGQDLPEKYELEKTAWNIVRNQKIGKGTCDTLPLGPNSRCLSFPWDKFRCDHDTIRKNSPQTKDRSDAANFPSTFEFRVHKGLSISSAKLDSDIQKILDLRTRFGTLLRWSSPHAEEALMLAQCINEALRTFKPKISDKLQPFVKVQVKTGPNEDNNDELYFALHDVRNPQASDPVWTVDLGQIEAALSLAAYCTDLVDVHLKLNEGSQTRDSDWLRETHRFPTSNRFCTRIVGPVKKSMARDLDWWSYTLTNGPRPKLEEVELDPHHAHNQIGITEGFASPGLSTSIKNGKQCYQFASILKHAQAVHIFTAFVWALASTIPDSQFDQTECNFKKGNDLQKLGQAQLMTSHLKELIQILEKLGLGSLHDLYLSIIPPLSLARKLPVEIVADQFCEGIVHEKALNWMKASQSYTDMLVSSRIFNEDVDDRFTLRSYALTIEFLIRATEEPIVLQPETGDCIRDSEFGLIRTLVHNLCIRSSFHPILWALRRLYQKQRRLVEFERVIPNNLKSEDYNGYRNNPLPNQDVDELVLYKKIEALGFRGKDVLGWSSSWYKVLDKEQACSWPGHKKQLEETDIAGMTFFHRLAALPDEEYSSDLIVRIWGFDAEKHGNVTAFFSRSGFGQIVLHRAAAYSAPNIVSKILEKVYHGVVDIADYAGRTPLSLAAWRGSPEIVWTLIAEDADISHADKFGQTPLILAARNGKQDAVEALVAAAINYESTGTFSAFLNHKDQVEYTALMYARKNGHSAVEQLLLSQDGIEDKTEDITKEEAEYDLGDDSEGRIEEIFDEDDDAE